MTQRLPYVDPDTLNADDRALLSASPLTLKRVLAHSNGALTPIYRAVAAMSATPELDPAVRELVILSAAADAGSEFEWVQHEPRARALGVSAGQLAALRTGDRLDGPAGVLVGYLRELFAGRQPDDSALAEVRSGVSVGGLVDAIMLHGIYLTFARLIEAAGLAPEPVFTPTPPAE